MPLFPILRWFIVLLRDSSIQSISAIGESWGGILYAFLVLALGIREMQAHEETGFWAKLVSAIWKDRRRLVWIPLIAFIPFVIMNGIANVYLQIRAANDKAYTADMGSNNRDSTIRKLQRDIVDRDGKIQKFREHRCFGPVTALSPAQIKTMGSVLKRNSQFSKTGIAISYTYGHHVSEAFADGIVNAMSAGGWVSVMAQPNSYPAKTCWGVMIRSLRMIPGESKKYAPILPATVILQKAFEAVEIQATQVNDYGDIPEPNGAQIIVDVCDMPTGN